MKKRLIGGFVALLVLGGAGATAYGQPANWMLDLITFGVSQTHVVRDPLDVGKYYLCWTDGTSRYGMKFSRRNLETRLSSLRPGDSAALDAMFTPDQSAWTLADDRTCFRR